MNMGKDQPQRGEGLGGRETDVQIRIPLIVSLKQRTKRTRRRCREQYVHEDGVLVHLFALAVGFRAMRHHVTHRGQCHLWEVHDFGDLPTDGRQTEHGRGIEDCAFGGRALIAVHVAQRHANRRP